MTVPDPPVPRHVECLAEYVPTHVDRVTWEKVAETVRDAVSLATASVSTAVRYRSHAAAFAVWAYDEGIAGSPATVFSAWTSSSATWRSGRAEALESTRATRRSILRRIARHAHPGLRVAAAPSPIAYRRVRVPYEAHEVASYFRLADAQPTDGRRTSLMAVLTLGLGCGLDCSDLGWVRGVDVVTTDDGIQVKVGGRRARQLSASPGTRPGWPTWPPLRVRTC